MKSTPNSSSFVVNSQSAKNKSPKRPPLNLEQLETRMLMAFDVLEQHLTELNSGEVPSLQASTVVGNLVGSLRQVGTTLPIVNNQRILSSSHSVQIQLLRDSTGNLPIISWQITSTDSLARGTVETSGEVATFTFNRPADYKIAATSGNRTLRFNVKITPSLTSVTIASGTTRLTQAPLLVSTKQATLTVIGLDQLDRTIKLTDAINWQVEQSPQGSNPQFQASGVRTKITFDRAGSYTFRASVGGKSATVNVTVLQKLTALSVTPGTSTINKSTALQFTATATDQFQQPMTSQPTMAWTATGGTINALGSYQAGTVAGNFRVTARAGTVLGKASVTVAASSNSGGQNNGIADSALRSLVTTYYADGSINREEMIQLLRSTGNDGTVSGTELTDLRYIVSTNSALRMPEFVRALTKNLVNANAANLKYQGQTAGNLSSGSSSVLLNKLVDKWFLGTDLPTVTGNGISYRFAVGSLFPSSPSLDDSKQGMLGDCYFLASLISIGVKNQSAIRNMFVENGDGTVVVRFFANGVADYVTVNRNLPTYSNGALAYSGYGRSVSSSSTQLWLALAEKAYAQWNETGKSGRDGSNTYAAIEGGWMGTVNAQALGYASSTYAVNSTNKQNLINALNSNQAVTIGTTTGATAGGLVGGHAYVVTGYNATSDAFSFYNPWSVQHPTALTWNQLQGQTSYFVVTSPAGSSDNGGRVSGALANQEIAQAASIELVLNTNSATDAEGVASTNTPATNEELPATGPLTIVDVETNDGSAIHQTCYQPTHTAEATHEELSGLLVDLSLLEMGI